MQEAHTTTLDNHFLLMSTSMAYSYTCRFAQHDLVRFFAAETSFKLGGLIPGGGG